MMDYQELHEYLDYNPTTGALTWKKKSGSKCKIGSEVGYVSTDGYRYFGFKGKTCKAHRAIFLMMKGYLPPFVDHDDHDRLNNKWLNLVESTMTNNNRNCSKQKNNKSGVVGVSWSADRKKWFAAIWHKGKILPLGRYADINDAIKVRKEAEIKYGYNPNHGK